VTDIGRSSSALTQHRLSDRAVSHLLGQYSSKISSGLSGGLLWAFAGGVWPRRKRETPQMGSYGESALTLRYRS